MAGTSDGPASPRFQAVPLRAPGRFDIGSHPVSERLKERFAEAPQGDCVFHGIPFSVRSPLVIHERPITVRLRPTRARWLVFLHSADILPLEENGHGFVSPMKGVGRLGETACTYRIGFSDGTGAALAMRRRFQIGAFERPWGENCFEAVAQRKPRPVRPPHEQLRDHWGSSQTRVMAGDEDGWLSWLWAWENPDPERIVTGLRVEPGNGAVLLFGVSAGDVADHPLRWGTRRKAVFSVDRPASFSFDHDDSGLYRDIALDLGQVISAQPRPLYDREAWEDGYDNKPPELSEREILVEYTAHPDALFHLTHGVTIAVSAVTEAVPTGPLRFVAPSRRRVTLRVVERGSSVPVAVKLHVHGAAGEYLAPVDRHRIPNAAWYEDYSVDFVHRGSHRCTYISGETTIDLPVGPVFVEIAKGFEIRPLRRTVVVEAATDLVTIEIDRVLPWRDKGWVTADTHVHFLSPVTALLEGRAEGVNVVNLLASQWGELMTNVGDFDGATTWGSRATGGDGEHLVRVGTENRQHVLGHISLLGYEGRIIAPMTVGGPDESALGDPVSGLLAEWAAACRKQGGLVIVPHFPEPRAEHAAAIVAGAVDGVEMTSWGNLYGGLHPYSLSDWYRYLNCGYLVAAVGGTDKMSADTAVGTVRTYAHIAADGRPFTYAEWMDAVRRAETFVTYGPLLELSVDGNPMGSRIAVPASGARLSVEWKVASVTVPVSAVQLIVNGEVRESRTVDSAGAAGQWTLSVERSSWAALLVRGHYPDRPEIIAAHSSPVMISVGETPFFAAADALTILEQIEGAIAFVDTVGTRAETAAYRRMRMELVSAHRALHNRLHEAGHYHAHSPVLDHEEHRRP